jgi:membrane protein DedA with SNARE-associated domain
MPKRRIVTRRVLRHAGAVLATVGVTIVIFLFAPQIYEFRRYGYTGIFLISLIANASILLPIPALAVTFGMGAALNWVLVGLAAGIGEALGESTGYLAGYGGSPIIENRQMFERMKYWMEHHGMLTIFILSAIPNPIIDLAGIAAGASRYGYYKFLFACWTGKTIKTLVFAWAGSHSVFWLLRILDLLG